MNYSKGTIYSSHRFMKTIKLFTIFLGFLSPDASDNEYSYLIWVLLQFPFTFSIIFFFDQNNLNREQTIECFRLYPIELRNELHECVFETGRQGKYVSK